MSHIFSIDDIGKIVHAVDITGNSRVGRLSRDVNKGFVTENGIAYEVGKFNQFNEIKEPSVILTILDEAKGLVHGQRHEDYGDPEADFTRTALLWSAILGFDVEPSKVPLCMIALKISRECNKHKRDNLVDIAGYAATIEMLDKG